MGSASARILVVEDDADINEIVAMKLSRAGHACTQAFSGTEAKLLLQAPDAAFDLVVCDLMLPGLTGEQLVALIRANDPATSIIVMSARTDPSDKIDLLRLGADDYLAKPFDLEELVARVEVQLRHRAGAAQTDNVFATGPAAVTAPAPLRFRAWELDPDARTLEAAGTSVSLTRTEFNLLELLVRRPNKVFTKRELFELAWGEPYAGDDNTVSVHVSNIRSKLRPSGTDAYIKTVWGMGFKLVGDDE